MIQLRRFMLLFVDVDFCASAMDVKLNSCPHCEIDTLENRLKVVVPAESYSETTLQGPSTASQSMSVDYRFSS